MSRFAPRLAPGLVEDARALADALAKACEDDAETLAARFAARAGDLLSPVGVLYAEPPGTHPDSALTGVERRLCLADTLADAVPPELFDGTPVRWAREPRSRHDVLAWWRAWRASRRGERLLVYVHVPFCRTRCSFCQFHSIASREQGEHALYVDSLLDEAAAFESALGVLDADAVTIGGGTPSELDEASLRRVLGALVGRVFRIAEGGYFSVELNPDSCTDGKVRALVDAGVNRISLGVQSFHEPTLHAVARGYQRAEMVEAAVRQVRGVSADVELGLDLLAPLPEESLATFEDGARRALALAPDQIVLFRYQPVRRGASTIEAGAMLFEHAAGRFLAMAATAGYEEVPHAGSSAIVQRPGARRFPIRYVQHPREPTSMLGLGPFAESHVLGHGRYVAEEDGGYRGEETTVRSEKASTLTRALGAGLSLASARYEEVFDESARATFGPELAYLEERGELVGVDLEPRFADRAAARRAAFLFFDELDLRRLRRAPEDLPGLCAWLRSAGATAPALDPVAEARLVSASAVVVVGADGVEGRIEGELHVDDAWEADLVVLGAGCLARPWARLVADGLLGRSALRAIRQGVVLVATPMAASPTALSALFEAIEQTLGTVPNVSAWETVSSVRVALRPELAITFEWGLAEGSRLRDAAENALAQALRAVIRDAPATYARSAHEAELRYAIASSEALDAALRAHPALWGRYAKITGELGARPRALVVPLRGARPVVDALSVELERVGRRRLPTRTGYPSFTSSPRWR